MTRTTGNSVSESVRGLGCVKNEAVGATIEDAGRKHVRGEIFDPIWSQVEPHLLNCF